MNSKTGQDSMMDEKLHVSCGREKVPTPWPKNQSHVNISGILWKEVR